MSDQNKQRVRDKDQRRMTKDANQHVHKFNPRPTVDNQRSGGPRTCTTATATNTRSAQFSRSNSNQAAMSHKYGDREGQLRKSSSPLPRKPSAELTSSKPVQRLKHQSKFTQNGYVIHRAEAMFDLSNIHLNPDDRGSMFDLLGEFQKQLGIPQSNPVANIKMADTKVDRSTRSQHIGKFYYYYSIDWSHW